MQPTGPNSPWWSALVRRRFPAIAACGASPIGLAASFFDEAHDDEPLAAAVFAAAFGFRCGQRFTDDALRGASLASQGFGHGSPKLNRSTTANTGGKHANSRVPRPAACVVERWAERSQVGGVTAVTAVRFGCWAFRRRRHMRVICFCLGGSLARDWRPAGACPR